MSRKAKNRVEIEYHDYDGSEHQIVAWRNGRKAVSAYLGSYQNRQRLSSVEKLQWLMALISQKYKQGESFLCAAPEPKESKAKYCCLGVKADVERRSFKWEDAGEHADVLTRWRKEYRGTYGSADESLLPDGATGRLHKSEQGLLAEMNDSGWTFKEIAQAIDLLF